jgi:hypothetical protein
MRYLAGKRVRATGLGLAALIVAGAAALAFAAGGRAASGNICTSPSGTPPTQAASCVTEAALPQFVSPGASALSVTKFVNQAGAGGATATHVLITVHFDQAVDVTSVSGGTSCTAAATGVTSASCSFGNISGGGSAKLLVVFTAPSTTHLTGEVTYGEGGGGPSNPPNDDQLNFATLTVGAGGTDGGCFSTQTANFSAVTGAQQTLVSGITNAGSSLPCTYADAGVLDGTNLTKTNISFVDFPSLSGATVVKILFTPLPKGLSISKMALHEDTNYATPYFTTFVTVPACTKSGNSYSIPNPVAPGEMIPQGTTDAVSHKNDSCIFSRASLKNGGGELDLLVIGTPPDGHYSG